MKTIHLIRKIYTNNSTIGQLSFDDFECWTLEPTARRIGDKPVCIPRGTYDVEILKSPGFKRDMPELVNVEGRSDILIHWGNAPKDTKGCILLGDGHKIDWVSNSRETFNLFYQKLQVSIKEGAVRINVS